MNQEVFAAVVDALARFDGVTVKPADLRVSERERRAHHAVSP